MGATGRVGADEPRPAQARPSREANALVTTAIWSAAMFDPALPFHNEGRDGDRGDDTRPESPDHGHVPEQISDHLDFVGRGWHPLLRRLHGQLLAV